MKFDQLKAIAHNIADSFEGPFGFPTIYDHARQSEDGRTTVDFLSGEVTSKTASTELTDAALRYRTAFVELCTKHSTAPSAFSQVKATYAVDRVYGGYYMVEMVDAAGRKSLERYHGASGRRAKPK